MVPHMGEINYHAESRRTVRTVTATVDPEQTVWIGQFRYHADRGGLPGCVEQRFHVEERTLEDAAAEGKRPCQKCHPPDYVGGDAGGL